MNTLGDVLYTLREKAAMRIEDLAYKAKISYSTIYKIETGAREPSARMLKKLAKALGVVPSEILKLSEKKDGK